MVNREGNFNRRSVSRNKTIRDKKRARIQNKKKSVGYENRPDPEPTKKEVKREKRLERILGGMKSKELNNLMSKRRSSRKSGKGRKAVKNANNNDNNIEMN